MGWPGKGSVLFAEDKLTKTAIICEGIFDALTASLAGYGPATCLLGKTISRDQTRILKQRKVEKIYVFLDRDANQEALKLAVLLYESKFQVNLCSWDYLELTDEEGKDPNEIGEKGCSYLLKRSIPIDYETAFRLQAQFL